MTPLEISANFVTTISILLAGRNNIHTWWTGILGCLLFAFLFLQSKLYADVALQAFFVVTSAIGWWQWLKGNHGNDLPISHANFRKVAWFVPAGLATTLAYGTILHIFTDAYAPFIDSAILAFSVIAQFLLMQRKIETWMFWLLVNTIAVPLYASRDLYLTSMLYIAYWINAVVSWIRWRRLMSNVSLNNT